MTQSLEFRRVMARDSSLQAEEIGIIGATRKDDYTLVGRITDQDTKEPLSSVLIRVAVNKPNGTYLLGYTESGMDGSYRFSFPREYINTQDRVLVQAIRK